MIKENEMAKITKQIKSTRGRAAFCGKCSKEIKPGMEYLKAVPYRQAPIIRCMECGIRPYETSGSEYVREVGALVEDWEANIGVSDSTVDEITEILESLKEQAQGSLDNIPEQLQEADTGIMLQERIDALDDAISSLEELESLDEFIEEAHDEAVEELGCEWPEDDDGTTGLSDYGYNTREEWENALTEAQNRLGSEAFTESIDEALCGLEY